MLKYYVFPVLFSAAFATSYATAASQTDDLGAEPEVSESIQPEVQWKKQFQALDKNNDGAIDSKEAKADKNLDRQFKTIAKKGKLDQSGYMNWQKAQQPRS